MKKSLVTFVTIICTVLGVTVVDKAIENRIVALESEVSQLQEICTSFERNNSLLSIGYELSCLPCTPFSLSSTYDYYAPEFIYDDAGHYDDVGKRISEDLTVIITQVSAVVTEKSNNPNTYNEFAYPYIIHQVIAGTTDSKYKGKYLDFQSHCGDIISFDNSASPIQPDGSFKVNYYYRTSAHSTPTVFIDEFHISDTPTLIKQNILVTTAVETTQ